WWGVRSGYVDWWKGEAGAIVRQSALTSTIIPIELRSSIVPSLVVVARWALKYGYGARVLASGCVELTSRCFASRGRSRGRVPVSTREQKGLKTWSAAGRGAVAGSTGMAAPALHT